jgi:hypothetical protein
MHRIPHGPASTCVRRVKTSDELPTAIAGLVASGAFGLDDGIIRLHNDATFKLVVTSEQLAMPAFFLSHQVEVVVCGWIQEPDFDTAI